MTPRPGERVVAYKSKTKIDGIFLGFDAKDDLLIKNSTSGYHTVKNHLIVRPAQPLRRRRACWHALKKPDQVVSASKDQVTSFNTLLNQRITPGPTYNEFIYEIWARGYEIFLVGGSVRDVIAGEPAHDVDLVTTMPPNLLTPLVEEMFGEGGHSRNPNNGFISVGYKASAKTPTKDPKIDLKNFFECLPGTIDAQFGSNMTIDQKLRDFRCNAIYYDPVNEIFVDPSSCAVKDIYAHQLNLINDTDLEHPEYRKANISFRYFKLILRGYTPTEECIQAMEKRIKPLFSTIGMEFVIPLFRRYILSKVPKGNYSEVVMKTRELMAQYGYNDIWEKYYEENISELTL